jgi:hypothetical protein
MRLIDADEIKLLQGFFEKIDNVPKFYEWLDEQPTVDAEPVRHGYWINEPDRYFHWHCSECGYVISGPHREFNYCPKCGTKMHGDK